MTSGSSEHLKILLVVEPGLDGVFRHVEGLIGFLLQKGESVHLAYSSRRSGQGMAALVHRVSAAGGSVVDLRISNTPQPRDLPALIGLVRLIRKLRPDVVHAHSSKAGALLRMAAAITGHKRCFYTPHAYYGMAKPPTPRVAFFNWIERIAARVGTTIAISRDEASFAERVLHVAKDRIRIIHNPADTARFEPPSTEQRRAARAKLGLPETGVIVGTIGRMCWQKDPETAYKGVAPLCRDHPEVFFCHLGWGTWKNYLLGFAEKLGLGSHLRIFDYVDDPRHFYHAVDVVLVTSRYEAGWPLVFLEALACDLPVVASRCTGMSDIDQAGLSHVWVFPAEDAVRCTEALARWYASHQAGRTNCNHRLFATERLSPERCYGAVLDLYTGVPASTVSPLEAPPLIARQ